jgi:ABC-type nickel/cobalt efflux system permease component RcnA
VSLAPSAMHSRQMSSGLLVSPTGRRMLVRLWNARLKMSHLRDTHTTHDTRHTTHDTRHTTNSHVSSSAVCRVRDW